MLAAYTEVYIPIGIEAYIPRKKAKEACFLAALGAVTARGEELILRRAGGNAFRDETLEALVGKTITGTGIVAGQTFIMHAGSGGVATRMIGHNE